MPPKQAIVTGAAKRIGRAIAFFLAQRGYDIALHYHTSQREANETAELIRRQGRICELFAADFFSSSDILGLMPRVAEQFPDISVMINSASIFEPGRLVETETEFFDRHFSINFKAPYFLCRDFARIFGKGNIVNLLDTQVRSNRTGHFAYLLTKKVLAEFTQMAAVELAPEIRVNGIAPGIILPPPGEDEDYIAPLIARIPLRSKGNPQDIAATVGFILDSPFITGEVIFVDGGEQAR